MSPTLKQLQELLLLLTPQHNTSLIIRTNSIIHTKTINKTNNTTFITKDND